MEVRYKAIALREPTKFDSMGKRTTPNNVTELSGCEIFVFGSNLAGQHLGGAARIAHEKFGAEWGVGDGPTGKCYAIPTMHGGVEAIKPYVDKFIQYAKEHPNNRFLVTRIGCGIAGFKDKEIAPMFLEALRIPNVTLPNRWILAFIDLNLDPEKVFGKFQEPEAPAVISEEVLQELTKKYAYPISNRLYRWIPSVGIRYVKDRDEFGYTTLAHCFFTEDGDFYVWDADERWKGEHNQAVVESFYGDECSGRGYAHKVIFAGVATGIKDVNGEMIYTGDVIHIGDDEYGNDWALGTTFNGEEYAFLLDNHALLLSECKGKALKRIGTVFYQLDKDEFPVPTINERTMRFQGWRDTSEDKESKKIMVRFTPNFDKEEWKYKALDTLGVEFKWNK